MALRPQYDEDPYHPTTVLQIAAGGPRILQLPSTMGAATFSVDGKSLAFEDSKSDTISIFDLASGERTPVSAAAKTDNPFASTSLRVEFSPDLSLALAFDAGNGDADSSVRLVELSKANTLHRFAAADARGCRFAFSDDGKQIALADEGVVVYDSASGAVSHKLALDSASAIKLVCFSPDGGLLACSGLDSTTIYKISNGKALSTFACGNSSRTTIAFSPDGKRVAVLDSSGQTFVFETITGKQILTLKPESNARGSIIWFDGDGKLISIIGDRDVIYRDSATGATRLTLQFLDADKEWFAVTPDGLFDGSERALQLIGVRVGERLETAPIGEAAKKHYRPGLLNAILRGVHPTGGGQD